MGKCFSRQTGKEKGTRLKKKSTRLLLVGLDGSGKTSVLYKLKLGEVVPTIPTIGFNVQTVKYEDLEHTVWDLEVWDVGGQEKIRPLWKHYYEDTKGIIFVVDSNDKDRIKEAKFELHHMILEQELEKVPILVIANKQDLPNAMTTTEVTDNLDLHSLNSHDWFIQGTSALDGQGLYEGLDWLSSKLK